MKPGSRWANYEPQLTLGEVDDDWFDDVHRRMFLYLERQLAALERAENALPDPAKEMRKNLDLLERVLKVRKLMQETSQQQPSLRTKRRGRSNRHATSRRARS